MRVAVSADERVGVAELLVEELKRRGHEVIAHGALASVARSQASESETTAECDRGREVSGRGALTAGERSGASGSGAAEREDWAWASEAAAREVARGHADQAVVCCWTGTGASIAANKVAGVRAALCVDAATAAGARRWNDANVLALSLRSTSEAELGEILDAWFAGEPSGKAEDRANIEHLGDIERSQGA